MKPLAYLIRPVSFDDIYGQEHLVGSDGVLTKMINTKNLFSFILYGNPGCGKTTIAEAACKMSGWKWFKFNASTDNKDYLKQIITESRYYENSIVIIDEIHRMKKDIQDFLLPHVENGLITMIGLTTVNPYHAINPAIRSRCHIYKLNDITLDIMNEVLENTLKKIDFQREMTDDAKEYLVKSANFEIRTLLNSIDTLVNTTTENIDLNLAIKTIQKSSVNMDKDGDNYYDTLSGLQKSIRGSDCDGALHYLAKLIIAGDLESICRRLLAISYEDISLANPGMGPKVVSACQAARELGFPEANLPLATIVLDMALSPKSNSAYLALNEALSDIEAGNSGTLPLHLKNTYSFDKTQKPYLYPHDYPNAWVKQQYLPDSLIDRKYYHPKPNSKYESALSQRYEQIENWKRNSN